MEVDTYIMRTGTSLVGYGLFLQPIAQFWVSEAFVALLDRKGKGRRAQPRAPKSKPSNLFSWQSFLVFPTYHWQIPIQRLKSERRPHPLRSARMQQPYWNIHVNISCFWSLGEEPRIPNGRVCPRSCCNSLKKVSQSMMYLGGELCPWQHMTERVFLWEQLSLSPNRLVAHGHIHTRCPLGFIHSDETLFLG